MILQHQGDSILELLQNLKWPSLCPDQKEASYRLIFLFRILNGLICISDQYLPSPFPITTIRSRHPTNKTATISWHKNRHLSLFIPT